MARGDPFGHGMRAQWLLEPDIVYLNHGTVGAPPRRVLAAQQAIRDEIERQPCVWSLSGWPANASTVSIETRRVS
jgi:hypothetical protein